MSGFYVLKNPRPRDAGDLPSWFFTGKELSAEEDARLRTLARSVVVKGVESPRAPARRDLAVPGIAWCPICRTRSRRC